MTLTVRSATVTGATTKGSPLTHAELDENWNHVANFTQSGSGATSRTVQAVLRDICINVKDFGAVCDDSTDDTAAIQAAIDSIGTTAVSVRGGPTILVPGPCRITDTLTIRRKSITFAGNGWGHRDDTGDRGSYLRWDGVAGSAMLKLSDNYGACVIRDIAFKGNASAKPSCAIELNETNDSQPNEQILIDHVRIGGFAGETGPGDGEQFTDGIIWSGTAVNNSEHQIRGLFITGCSGAGVELSAIQNVNINIDHLTVKQCGTGMYVTGQVTGKNWNFSHCDIDIQIPVSDVSASTVDAIVTVQNYYSENAGRMIEAAGVGRVTVNGGQFQITDDLNADGKIIKWENLNLALKMRDFNFTQASAPPASPYMSLRTNSGGARDKQIIIDGVTGWSNMTGGTNGLDVATRGPTDRTYIYFHEYPQTGASTPARLARNFLHGTDVDWDINRFQTRNDTGLQWMDDFLGDVLADQWGNHAGTDGGIATPAVTAIHGGACRFTTGANASADMAGNGVQLESALNWSAQFGGLAIEARLRVSSATSVALFFGFTDQVSALEMPFTLGGSDALTSNATDAVGWLFDTGADTDNWWLVGVANDVDATKQNSALAPDNNTFEVLRVEITSGGAATFWRNGKQIGSSMTGATRTTVNLTPVVAAFSRSASGRNVDIDYISVQSNRWLP